MVADFTGDGYADYADRNRSTGEFWVHQNYRNGTFAPAGTNWGYAVSCSSANCETLVGDFNGDHYADYADWDRSTGVFNIRLNLKSGAFASWSYGSATTGAGYDEDLLIADFNGDGYADYADRSRTSGTIYVHLNQKNGTFAGFGNNWAVMQGCNGKECEVIVGDFTGDGLADYADHLVGDGEMWVHKNYGDGTFAGKGVNWAYLSTCGGATCNVMGYRGQQP